MDTRIVVLLLCHVVRSAQMNRTVYIGCYERNDYTHYEWHRSWLTTKESKIYYDCESRAKERGWEVFVVNGDSSCHGTEFENSLKLLSDTGARKEESDCSSKGAGGKLGGPESMATYHIIEDHNVTFSTEIEPSIRCDSDKTEIKIFSATLYNPVNCGGGKTTMDVMSEFRKECENGKSYCKYEDNFNDFDCRYTSLNVTYGCAIKYKDYVHRDSFGGYGWLVAFPPAIAVGLYLFYEKKEECLREFPGMRGPFWKLHKCCPCLKIYPEHATGPNSMFEVDLANVQPNPVADDTNPPPADSATFPPPVEIPPPYDPSNPQNSGQMAIPPPSYSDVVETSGTTRTSGGWFTKAMQP